MSDQPEAAPPEPANAPKWWQYPVGGLAATLFVVGFLIGAVPFLLGIPPAGGNAGGDVAGMAFLFGVMAGFLALLAGVPLAALIGWAKTRPKKKP